MSGPRWSEVRELFESLVDEPPAIARQRLEEVRRTHPDVAGEVASLLDHHGQAGAFLAQAAVLDTGDPAFAPGTQLGAYRIEREIGHGGMGRVYLAVDTRLERRVCLKMVRGEVADTPALRDRLRTEARLAGSISHPGICAVYALEEVEGTLFVVTEFVDGHTLRVEMERQPFGRDALVTTVRELAAALDAAHRKGITHRDLKPENIMRAADGRLKILDFGLARSDGVEGSAVPHATARGVRMGTLPYMAPEQIEGLGADPRTDLFALGVIAYECATGRHPFAAATPLAMSARIIGSEPTPIDDLRPDLPPAVPLAIARCLAKSRDDRMPSAAALLAAIGDGAGPAAASAHGVGWWRIHQVVMIATYLAASMLAWAIKEWDGAAATRWAFLAIGVFAAANGIVRAHLLFTERANRLHLARQRRRTRLPLVSLDATLALLLFWDAVAIANGRPVAAVLIMALAVGIAAAALLIEPATSAAAFGER